MNSLTHSELRQMLQDEKDVLDIELTITSPVTLKKTGNPYSNIQFFKTVTFTGQIGRSYRKDKQDSQSHEYIPHERSWGKLINPYIVEHKNAYYLQLFVDTQTQPIYQQLNENKLDEINVQLIQDFLPVRSVTIGKDEDVILRDIKFDNIRNITIKNEKYEVIPDVQHRV